MYVHVYTNNVQIALSALGKVALYNYCYFVNMGACRIFGKVEQAQKKGLPLGEKGLPHGEKGPHMERRAPLSRTPPPPPHTEKKNY